MIEYAHYNVMNNLMVKADLAQGPLVHKKFRLTTSQKFMQLEMAR